MNVFVLNTGRCGSVTFSRACQHITNFSAAHESRTAMLGENRLRFPENHIEADNRLSWFLGRLDKTYGDDAFYVHLSRNSVDTAKSYSKRYTFGIINAYRGMGILMGLEDRSTSPFEVCLDYCNTVNSNIELFLKDKTKTMQITLENIKEDFVQFWERIGAEGDLDAALAEFDVKYNASPTTLQQTKPVKQRTSLPKIGEKKIKVRRYKLR